MNRSRAIHVFACGLVAMTAASAPTSAVEINKDVIQSWKVLVKGAPIHGANGIAFDSSDQLHIASVLGREIVVMDPDSGRILDRLDPTMGVESPDDLTFGPDGSLYWTAFFTGDVGRMTPDGVTSVVGTVFPGVNPITFSDDGRLFVAHDFTMFSGLYEIDPDGGSPPTLLDPNYYNLNAFDFGPDGLLYGPIFQEKIIRIDVDALWSEDILDPFPSAAVKFDSHGRLHAVNVDQVVQIDPTTGAVEVVAHVGPGLDNLAFDSRGRLFVSSFLDGAIYRVLPSGNVREVSPGGMTGPGGVAVLPRSQGRESVFVADTFSFREFDARTGLPVNLEEVFGYAQTIAPFGKDLVVSGWFNNSVEVRHGRTLHLIDGPYFFDVPLNAIEFQGDFIVAEIGPPGRVVRSDHTPISDVLAVPTGLAATDTDLWVADWFLGTVFKIVENGVPISPPRAVASGLSFPEGLAINTDGSLLVVETGVGRLSSIDPDTGVVTVVAEGLELGAQAPANAAPTWTFNGVAVGPSGNIYVTGEMGSVIYRFKQHP